MWTSLCLRVLLFTLTQQILMSTRPLDVHVTVGMDSLNSHLSNQTAKDAGNICLNDPDAGMPYEEFNQSCENALMT